MRVDVVDPSAYTPPYDHSLCAALAATGADVRLITSHFAYGSVPSPDGYRREDVFYRRAVGAPGSRLRLASKLLQHGPDMYRYRRLARAADVVHFQWLPVGWLDRLMLPDRPTVLTAHDLLPREPRPGQVTAQRRLYDAVDAVVAHSGFGRSQLIDVLGLPAEKVHLIRHGAFDYLSRLNGARLPPELAGATAQGVPVVLFFGLLRPYKGVPCLLEAWRRLPEAVGGEAELWVVGHPRVPLEPLRALAPPGVRFLPRFVDDAELAGCFGRADLVVLPYLRTERLDFSGVLATALAFGTPSVVSDVGGFAEVAESGAARLVPPGDPPALTAVLAELIEDAGQRARLAEAARGAAAGSYSWTEAADRTMALYEAIA